MNKRRRKKAIKKAAHWEKYNSGIVLNVMAGRRRRRKKPPQLTHREKHFTVSLSNPN